LASSSVNFLVSPTLSSRKTSVWLLRHLLQVARSSSRFVITFVRSLDLPPALSSRLLGR
jgi:hypothetical protein